MKHCTEKCGSPTSPLKAFILVCALWSLALSGLSTPAQLVDFSRKGHGWTGNEHTREKYQDGGFTCELTGDPDPWIEGPEILIPEYGRATKLGLRLAAKATVKGEFKLFFAERGEKFSRVSSVQLVPSAVSENLYEGVIPVTAERLRFRIDPPGTEGSVTFFALKAVPIIPVFAPNFERPMPVPLDKDVFILESEGLRILHVINRWNAFAVFVNGVKMAESNPAEAIAYVERGEVSLISMAQARATVSPDSDQLHVVATLCDPGGAEWRLGRRFRVINHAVQVETSLSVDKPRELVHFPWMTLFAGIGTFGEMKSQALLPGVEYLENEPSSNEKEIQGTFANRKLVSSLKICYPMMALAANDNWLSLAWQEGEIAASPLFDTPDRVFHSGGHVMGVWSPSVGKARDEGGLSVYDGVPIQPGQDYMCSVTLCGGRGNHVATATEQHIRRVGLPPVPQYAGTFEDVVRLLSAGWLDSLLRKGACWRHAVAPGNHFTPKTAEDVPAYLLWLATQTSDKTLKERLVKTSDEALAALPKGCMAIRGISHVNRPVGALLYGDLEGLVKHARVQADLSAQHLSAGLVRYTPGQGQRAPNKVDFASTLNTNHCNGLTAIAAEDMLGYATLTGNEKTIGSALSVLDKMSQNYSGQVPRGAQPWEMPLHAPDLVAAARLTRCYVLGYLLSGNSAYMAQARYWAWAGANLVYVASPVSEGIGAYATIGVLGSTNWQWRHWIGLPVQWCGLVYRSSLEELARIDDKNRSVWETLAHGITFAGLQMCYPLAHEDGLGGLLPDYFFLRQQERGGPAINPGTLQAHLPEAYGKPPMYSVARLHNQSLVHALGAVREVNAYPNELVTDIALWPESECRVLVTRLKEMPAIVRWKGVSIPFRYLDEEQVLIVSVKGSGQLDIDL